jgi:hypothetical protein
MALSTPRHDAEWTQIDHCIVTWIYLTVSKMIRDMVFHRRATTFSAWNACTASSSTTRRSR